MISCWRIPEEVLCRVSSSNSREDEENVALIAKGKKKSKKGPNQGVAKKQQQ